MNLAEALKMKDIGSDLWGVFLLFMDARAEYSDVRRITTAANTLLLIWDYFSIL